LWEQCQCLQLRIVFTLLLDAVRWLPINGHNMNKRDPQIYFSLIKSQNKLGNVCIVKLLCCVFSSENLVLQIVYSYSWLPATVLQSMGSAPHAFKLTLLLEHQENIPFS
jgi:hypothetical protein